MTRQEWTDSFSALRKLMNTLSLSERLEEGTEYRLFQYKFGAVWNTRYKMWYIWNGKTENIIATVKTTDRAVTIRYRENSVYAGYLKQMVYNGFNMRYVKSQNLSRNKRYVRDELHETVRREISRFLERRRIAELERSERLSSRIPQEGSMPLTGQTSPRSQGWTVQIPMMMPMATSGLSLDSAITLIQITTRTEPTGIFRRWIETAVQELSDWYRSSDRTMPQRLDEDELRTVYADIFPERWQSWQTEFYHEENRRAVQQQMRDAMAQSQQAYFERGLQNVPNPMWETTTASGTSLGLDDLRRVSETMEAADAAFRAEYTADTVDRINGRLGG